MATLIGVVSIFVLCAMFGGSILDFICTIIGVLFIVAIHCIIGGAIGWLLVLLFTSSMAAAIPGFGIGCVVGLIWFFVKKSY